MSASRHLLRGYTAPTVSIAAIAFDLDPLLRLGEGLAVRWQTVGLAVVVAMCLAATGIVVRRNGLRADDLLYVIIGAVPGAVVGGRLGYALLVPEAFSVGPITLLDPAVGGLELGLAVVGGLLTGATVATLLGTPMSLLTHALAIPLLVALAAGKLTMILGGSGQGLPLDAPWATAFVGPGPWGSVAAAIPSHPSQVYEGVGTGVMAALVMLATSFGGFRVRDGSRLLVAVAGWAVVRAAVSATWRDPIVAGPFPAGGLISVAIAMAAVAGLVVVRTWLPRRQRARDVAAQPTWADPEARPRF